MLTWRTIAGAVAAVVILTLLVAHTLTLPGVQVDQVSIGLLILMVAALLLPDLTRLIGPGGWEADFQRNVADAERGLAQIPQPLSGQPSPTASQPAPDRAAPASPDAPDQASNLMATVRPNWPMDAGLYLAHLRVALEGVLRRLDGVSDGAPLTTVLERLARQRRVSPGLQRSVEAFISATDAFLSSRRPLVPTSVTRALTVGEELLRRLTAGPGGV